VEILEVDNKKPETRTEAFEKCVDVIKGAGKKIGTIARSEATGPFADEWRKIYGDAGKDVDEVDISQALSTVFAVKDETELRSMRTASRACSGMISDFWVDQMAEVLDSEKKVTHASLAKKIADKIDDSKFFSKISKLPADFDSLQLDWAYGPVIQI
jgi:nucleosome binding factor SPN SPT16 subunit